MDGFTRCGYLNMGIFKFSFFNSLSNILILQQPNLFKICFKNTKK